MADGTKRAVILDTASGFGEYLVAIVAVEGAVNDWSAYVGIGSGRDYADWIARRGTKVPHNVARFYFPDWDDRLTWRS